MASTLALPRIVQGGMGVAVSDWRLASAVSAAGQLGVVSGTALDTVLARRLQDGDPGGAMRRALARFPDPAAVAEALERYFREGGRAQGAPYRTLPLPRVRTNLHLDRMAMLGAFVEVTLAKESHGRPVGFNLLTKVRTQTLPTLFGALLAGVDWVLMGAGIPRDIPGVLDRLALRQAAELALPVAGTKADGPEPRLRFDPAMHGFGTGPELQRPAFVPIVSSDALATLLATRADGPVQGFVIEGPTAGGHIAPPRGRKQEGAPVYGPRDAPNLEAIRDLGLPFWLAGGSGTPERLQAALDLGAAGIQVGTLFAACRESGLQERYKADLIRAAREGREVVRTDPRASPTGFPFKIADLPGTIAEAAVQEGRERRCDLGYLREAARLQDGRVVFRCPAEPVDAYLAKGGKLEDTVDRACLCNGLTAAVGMPQRTADGGEEPAILTIGDALSHVPRLLPPGATGYGARDVIDFLTGGVQA